jgi:hypothetical protein
MTNYIFLGHGGLDTGSTDYPGMGEILIPKDTTLKVYSDPGHTLSIPATVEGGKTLSDYRTIAGRVNGWQGWQEAKGEMGFQRPCYNFRLTPETHEEERLLAESLDWGGAQVISLPKGTQPFYLCQGTPDSCPTPALLTSTDEAVITNPKRWEHDCEGILGQYGGSGNNLFWMVCTSLLRNTLQEWKDLLGGDDRLDDQRDWTPDAGARTQIKTTNQKAVKSTDNGGEVDIYACDDLVLIGNDHGDGPMSYLNRADGREKGKLVVTKGGAFSRGKVEITGITKFQKEVEEAIEDFSKKGVKFA